MKCKDCDQFEQCEYYNGRKGTSKICSMFTNNYQKIAELEKIKAEIEERSWYHEHFEYRLVEICETDKIIDKHIAELKGE